MNSNFLPAVWVIVMIAGLSMLSETIYTPTLPDIAKSLEALHSEVESTLSIYLFGFAFGVLFFGIISDKLGRKPCIIAGLFLFVIGSFGCYLSNNIEFLIISRFVQAFGASIGSVLGQAICRDAFHGKDLIRVYSAIAGALALFPAVGPVFGGLITEFFGWRDIFLFLIGFGVILIIIIFLKLPETLQIKSRKVNIFKLSISLLKNKKVIAFGLLVAGCNGITFSYFAEGSFCLIDHLGLTPKVYGMSFLFIALSVMSAGILLKKLNDKYHPEQTIEIGIFIILLSNLVLSLCLLMHLSNTLMIVSIIISQMFNAFSIRMITSNSLALALVDYKYAVGSASSLFGFFYYVVISFLTFVMSWLHNGTLIVMPLYFLSISVFMLFIKKLLLKH